MGFYDDVIRRLVQDLFNGLERHQLSNLNNQAPAFVPQGGTSRRQAKSKIISIDPMFKPKMIDFSLFRALRNWALLGC